MIAAYSSLLCELIIVLSYLSVAIHSVSIYEPIAQGEAFGEQFIANAYDFLPECFAPTGCIFCPFCKPFYWAGALGKKPMDIPALVANQTDG